ncbi:EthD domain-containing protein [Aspergillus pseudonomiae]|uniref:EthD domain-containing protein n=1 Tax=Aspergillus pseudonomiae TaxID=1506151 RepID=A0A5N6HQA6_9EURO|nr:EthD domain-containing protein [Aspergillus pseudonomiae]KAB8256545.1 EthD domain-containing protein [Aspergillus pseudonomiae]KAE8400202.1 EthD domain-containing protein [Aspergillus pseudonomiae]
MVYKALLYVTRKSGTTPAEFRAHYETVHIPLIQKLTGADFPLSHRRVYPARPVPGEDNSFPATVLIGAQEDFTFDVVVEVTFRDEAACKVFTARRQEPGTKELVDADEEKFLDPTKFKAVVLGEVQETTS